jgi:hypothetical protein
MGKLRLAHQVFVRQLKGRDHFANLSVDGRIILKCILNE